MSSGYGDDWRTSQPHVSEQDPRIIHVASELVVDLGPEAENDGNMEYVLDVIDAMDYANEQCGKDYSAGQRDALAGAIERVGRLPWPFVDPPGVLETVITAIKGSDSDGATR